MRLRGNGSPAADGQDRQISFPAWEQFTDGRLRRLKRGKHYDGNPAILLHEAKVAARELGKRAVSYHDQLGKVAYIWLQFVENPLLATGDPCPRCDGTELERVQEYFLRCLTCSALYKLRDKRPTTTAAEIRTARVLAPDGTEIQEMRVFDEAIVEAACEFHRPVAAAHVSFMFSSDGRTALRSGSPDLIEVPTADTVRIRLNLDAGVLSAGEYSLVARLELVLDEQDRRFHSIRSRDRVQLHVLDPADPDERGAGRERSRLHWSAVSALDGAPMPVVDDGEATGEDEPDDEDEGAEP